MLGGGQRTGGRKLKKDKPLGRAGRSPGRSTEKGTLRGADAQADPLPTRVQSLAGREAGWAAGWDPSKWTLSTSWRDASSLPDNHVWGLLPWELRTAMSEGAAGRGGCWRNQASD